MDVSRIGALLATRFGNDLAEEALSHALLALCERGGSVDNLDRFLFVAARNYAHQAFRRKREELHAWSELYSLEHADAYRPGVVERYTDAQRESWRKVNERRAEDDEYKRLRARQRRLQRGNRRVKRNIKRSRVQWEKNNPQSRRDRAARWRARNPKLHKELVTAWHFANPERHKEHTAKWREKNRGAERARARDYRARKKAERVLDA